MKTINQPHFRITDPEKPQCPRHRRDMRFDKARSSWVCTEDGCKVIARRKEDDLVSSKPSFDKPEQMRLVIETNEDGEESYFLVAKIGDTPKEYGIDVTDHVEMIIDDQTNSVTLCLIFNNVNRIRALPI